MGNFCLILLILLIVLLYTNGWIGSSASEHNTPEFNPNDPQGPQNPDGPPPPGGNRTPQLYPVVNSPNMNIPGLELPPLQLNPSINHNRPVAINPQNHPIRPRPVDIPLLNLNINQLRFSRNRRHQIRCDVPPQPPRNWLGPRPPPPPPPPPGVGA